MIVFNGRQKSIEKESELKFLLSNEKLDRPPKVVDIMVEPDEATKIYVSLKQKAAKRVGIEMEVVTFDDLATNQDILDKISELNKDNSVDGILVQMPLPKKFSIDERDQIVFWIKPEKDVDGLGKKNIFPPATVRGILEILEIAEVSTRDQILVVGKNGMIGKKLMEYLQIKGYKVGGIDKETKSITSNTKTADVVISCTGVSGLIKPEMLKKDCVVVDVGAPNGEFVWEGLDRVARFATPVPGGVGPMTIVSLLENVIEAAISFR